MAPTVRQALALSLGTVFVALPALYYSYVEINRTRQVRRRRRRYHAALADTSSIASSATDAAGPAELEEIKLAFASYSIGGRYSNPFPEWREAGAWEFLFWKLLYGPLITNKIGWDGGLPKTKEELADSLPFERFRVDEKEDQEEMSVTWIGQSTCYLKMKGVGYLTDPVFAHKTLDSFLAPPRLRPPPCQLSDLADKLDIVLVSHSHFDHLHPDVVLSLGNTVQWFVPLGLKSYFTQLGVSNERVREMDWWDSVEATVRDKKVKITCTPAMHWCGRTLWDTNRSLWCSFLVQEPEGKSFYHCGDTGYSGDLFKAIGRVSGGVDVALIPIGSYEPRWHLRTQHCNPDDAVLLHRDVGAKYSLAVHWGTWSLSDEHYLAPPRDLQIAKEKYHIRAEGEFDTVPVGRTTIIYPAKQHV